jgi:hypothetical protein
MMRKRMMMKRMKRMRMVMKRMRRMRMSDGERTRR